MIIAIASNLHAGKGDNQSDELESFSCTKQCLRYVEKKPILDDENQDPLNYIEHVPPEILWQICYKLSPPNIISLTLVSQYFRSNINNDFWESYIRINNQEKWEQSVDAVKVAFAFSLFEQGEIDKAASLGLPSDEIIRKQENEKIAKEWQRAKMKAKMRERGKMHRNSPPEYRQFHCSNIFEQKLNPCEFDY